MKRYWMYLLCSLMAISMLACAGGAGVKRVEVRKDSHIFAIKGSDTLSLDRYELPANPSDGKRPVMIFAFGGGFRGGDRADNGYIQYFEFLARNGFVVVSVDYRTALKDLDASMVSSPEGFVAKLQEAIDIAVEDLYDATTFVVNKAEDWSVDATKVMASGSSAGAITVLQAEYYICNAHPLAGRLPDGFNYAGVISYAGAVADVVAPRWAKAPCPMMLFHGDADRIVPFDKAAMDGLGGLWGSASIVRSLDSLKCPYAFYVVENADHEISGVPMSRNLYDIIGFLSRQALGKESISLNVVEAQPGDSAVRKDFTVQDYIKNNLP